MKALVLLLACPALWALPASEAGTHVGETAEVCGYVASIHKGKGDKPTFLNLGKPYPNQEFSLVIWNGHTPLFGNIEEVSKYLGKQVCAFGIIKRYRGMPEMILNVPSELKESKN
jgi:hypothetical protein